MTRENLLDLGPSLLAAAGIVGSTLIAVRVAGSGGWFLAAPLLLALTVVGADAWRSRRRGGPASPSWAALILGGSFLLASLIIGFRDPRLAGALLAISGSAGWVTLRPRSRGRTCGSV